MSDRPEKVFRVGIDGLWRKIASAVRDEALGFHEVVSAVHNAADERAFTEAKVTNALNAMISRRLIYANDKRFKATAMAVRQLDRPVDYMPVDEAVRLGLTPGPHSGPARRAD